MPFSFLSFRIHNLQLLDLPGIIEGAKDGKGRGRQVIAGEGVVWLSPLEKVLEIVSQ